MIDWNIRLRMSMALRAKALRLFEQISGEGDEETSSNPPIASEASSQACVHVLDSERGTINLIQSRSGSLMKLRKQVCIQIESHRD